MRASPEERYRRWLVVLPAALRREAEDELVETFRRSHERVAGRGLAERVRFWCRMAADLALASGAERLTRGRPSAERPRASLWETLMRLLTDLRLAARALRKSPAFAVTAVLTLALGIGATTTMFSVVNGVLLAPLPYKNPARLVLVWQELRARHVPEFPFPPGDIPDLRVRGTTFEALATVTTGQQSLASDASQPEQVRTAFVSANIFRVLGLQIEHGRDFTDADAVPPPPPPGAPGVPAPTGAAPPNAAPTATVAPPPVNFAVILSHEYWQRRYGGDLTAIGRSIDLGGAGATIVGIVEPNAQLLFPPRTNIERAPDLWFASRADLANGTRTAGALRVIARLAPGATVASAQTQMEGFAADLRAQYPVKKNAGVYIDVVSMHESLVSDVRRSILALMGAVVIVLLIACANVASLFLTQAARRERDLAVRTALGAGRGRLVSQMFAESVWLAVTGAALGLGLAKVSITVLQRIGPTDLPRLFSVAIDLKVLAFAAGLALATAAFFGLLPALRASRPDVVTVLRQAGRTAGLGAGRLRGGLVVVEVALSFVLLVGSALMLRSLVALEHVNPGFDPRGVLTFYIPQLRGQTPEARSAQVDRIREELRALPGVQGIGAATPLPLDGRVANMPWGTEAAASDPTLFQQAVVHVVQPGYFEAMRAPVVEGRTFQLTDNVPTSTNVIIDSALAAKAFPGESAVGKKLLLRLTGQTGVPFEVIGVVAHERHASLSEEGREALFFADGQRGFATANRWVVRTSVPDPMSLADGVKAAIARVDPTAAVADVQLMQAFVDRAQAPTRFALVLASVFAIIAAALAVVGLYGVLSTVVRQRTAEIGVRLAFGAERASIFRLIVGRGLALAGVGIVIGAGAALTMTRGIASLLVGVRATDPASFLAIAVLFLLVALAACGLPAYRASRLDPTAALRSE
jgi:putative ABC transport system permease protein